MRAVRGKGLKSPRRGCGEGIGRRPEARGPVEMRWSPAHGAANSMSYSVTRARRQLRASALPALQWGLEKERLMGKLLMVGGVFDDQGGRASGYAKKLFAEIGLHWSGEVEVVNGGAFKDLESRAGQAGKSDALVWLADVPNDKPKLVAKLRQASPELVLCIGKNNRAGKYLPSQLSARMAAAGAFLMLEFVSAGEEGVGANLRGPGGELLAGPTCDIGKVARAAAEELSKASAGQGGGHGKA